VTRLTFPKNDSIPFNGTRKKHKQIKAVL